MSEEKDVVLMEKRKEVVLPEIAFIKQLDPVKIDLMHRESTNRSTDFHKATNVVLATIAPHKPGLMRRPTYEFNFFDNVFIILAKMFDYESFTYLMAWLDNEYSQEHMNPYQKGPGSLGFEMLLATRYFDSHQEEVKELDSSDYSKRTSIVFSNDSMKITQAIVNSQEIIDSEIMRLAAIMSIWNPEYHISECLASIVDFDLQEHLRE